MKKVYLYVMIVATFSHIKNIYAQGCVAIRGNSTCGASSGNSLNLKKGELNAQMGFRYFKSFRHFRGDEQEKNRVEDGTEVINKSSFLDFTLSYALTDRFYITSILPMVNNNRSSMYEHGGNPPSGLGERHETSSIGLSDIRLGIGYWLFAPKKHDFNYSIGLGVKLPTGKYDYKDMFYNQGVNRNEDLEKVVDQSIQLGDGGIGAIIDIQGYHKLSHHIALSTNFFYLFNVRETNGVLTRNGNSEFSCPDQFALRIAGNYNLMNGLNFSLGTRLEGIPSEDIIGGGAGFRRPGYVVSIEPGMGFRKNNYSFFISCPIAIYRNRTQSFEDKVRTQQTGVYTHGDAAFADYVINLGVSYRLRGSKKL